MLRSFFKKLPQNIAGTFRGNNWVWHLIMIAITFFLVTTGFDWWYYESTRIPLLLKFAIPAGAIGFFTPILSPIIIYYVAEEIKNLKLRLSAIAIAQAGVIAIILSSVYKAFTGRLQPQLVAHPPLTVDISEAFHFGFLQHGIFWGWPSSHTTVAFAMAITLALLYRKNKVLVSLVVLYAIYIGLAVSITIHWFSDFVAGAILGTVIAFVVARSYKTQQ